MKTFLQQQDERVKEIEKKAIAQYKNLNNKYVQKALSNRIIARIEHKEYDSLTKIQWELNKSHKIAVNLLTQKTPISEQHPKFKEGKIEIDSLVKEKKLKINTKTSASITKLKEQQQKEINEVIKQNSKDNHLLQNLKRLFKGSRWRDNEETLLSTKSYLKLLDFYSISQIKKIDSRNGFIHLLSGVHNKISIKDFKDHKIVMKNLLQWFDESKHQKEFKLKKIAEIKQRYRLKTKELDDQKRISLKGLSREKKEQLEKVKIEVQKVVLGAPFTKLQEQHETVTEYIDELQTDYVEEENLILQDYNILHEQIIKESKAKVSLTEQNIKALENKLQVYNNKISHPKIQANYKLFETELRQLKNIVKNLEIKESEYQKYQNISYYSFLEHIIKQK